MSTQASRRGIRQHWRVVLPVAGMIAGMTGLVIYAPTLYAVFCDLTGYGGTVQRGAEVRAAPVDASARRVRILFDANVDPRLPWSFEPEQRSVEARLGEPVRAYYRAKNNSDETIVARATFNVTPYKAAPYFFKIECFCFTEERLGPGESARMPLELFIDEQLAREANLNDVGQITLSYTFFRQADLTPEEVAEARDLAKESEALDAQLEREGAVGFDNDAPRR